VPILQHTTIKQESQRVVDTIESLSNYWRIPSSVGFRYRTYVISHQNTTHTSENNRHIVTISQFGSLESQKSLLLTGSISG